VSRRTVLAAGLAAGALAGCTGGSPAPAPAPTTPPPPDPLLAEHADEVLLLARYDATLARHPGLRPRLAGPRDDHARHVAALAGVLGLPGAAATGSAAAGSPPAGADPTGPDPTGGGTPGPVVAATPAAALAALRAAERAAARARSAAALDAPAERAGLLAGIAASESSHLVVLA
jgi:hypothetical protein